jgi:benzoyl-CoA reductase/2-hydroxyglutaryl-CoA dehydratase subunit BcrC/BadD/HgdB
MKGMISMSTVYSIIKKNKDEGRRIIGCFPLYPPLELLHSMGFTPFILWGLRDDYHNVPLSDRHLQAYACSVGRCLTEFTLRHGGELFDGIVMYNACDTLRNLPEILQHGLAEQGRALPLFRLHIPTSPLSQASDAEYFRGRVRRLIHELEESFGVTFSIESFRKSVEIYRTQRELSARLQGMTAKEHLSFNEFCRIVGAGNYIPVEEHIALLEHATAQSSTTQESGQVLPGVMVSGILPPSPRIIDCIETSGMRVADNDIAMFKRTYGYTPSSAHDTAEYYIDLYSKHHPCTTILHTGDARVEELRKTVREGDIKGFIFIGEKFCEYEYFEIPYLRKVLEDEGVRILCLDFSLEDDENIGSYQTRIEAFAETLGG